MSEAAKLAIERGACVALESFGLGDIDASDHLAHPRSLKEWAKDRLEWIDAAKILLDECLQVHDERLEETARCLDDERHSMVDAVAAEIEGLLALDSLSPTDRTGLANDWALTGNLAALMRGRAIALFQQRMQRREDAANGPTVEQKRAAIVEGAVRSIRDWELDLEGIESPVGWVQAMDWDAFANATVDAFFDPSGHVLSGVRFSDHAAARMMEWIGDHMLTAYERAHNLGGPCYVAESMRSDKALRAALATQLQQAFVDNVRSLRSE